MRVYLETGLYHFQRTCDHGPDGSTDSTKCQYAMDAVLSIPSSNKSHPKGSLFVRFAHLRLPGHPNGEIAANKKFIKGYFIKAKI